MTVLLHDLCASGGGKERWRFSELTRALEFHEGIERVEEVAADGGVVAEKGVPLIGRPRHEGYGDRVMRV
ncbi:MAG TPA: hypothetical protein VEX68_21390 [Bryobacteraceae bacterium]|nr:hypothetical protein [Bryobacteraceae bacterium]